MSEEITEFVKRHKNGSSWTELEEEFVENRGWSKGKFVNHFKEAKKRLTKKLNSEGRPRYFYQDKQKEKKRIGFFEWLEHRSEKEELKRKQDLKESEAESEAALETTQMNEDEWTQEKEWKIRKKWRRRADA